MEFDSLLLQEIRALNDSELTFDVTEEIKKRIYDTIINSWTNEKNIRSIAGVLSPSYGKQNSTIFFKKERAITEYVSMINTMMLEQSNCRDFYPSRMENHPSDAIPSIIAHAENEASKGYDLIKAVYGSYQISSTFSEFIEKTGNYKSGIPQSIGIATGICLIHDVKDEFFRKMLNYSINIGDEERKFYYFNKYRSSYYARELSFLYRLNDSLPDVNLDPNIFKNMEGEHFLDFKKDRVSKNVMKYYEVDDLLLSAVEIANEMRENVKGNILDVAILIPEIIEMRNVRNGEINDNTDIKSMIRSLKFAVAYTYFYGLPRSESYNESFLNDINIRNLMDKMKIRTLEEYDRLFPEFLPTKLTFQTDQGIYEREIDVPYGYFRNPMTWNDLKNKGFRLTRNEDFVNSLMDFIKNIDDKSIEELVEVLGNAPIKEQQESGSGSS